MRKPTKFEPSQQYLFALLALEREVVTPEDLRAAVREYRSGSVSCLITRLVDSQAVAAGPAESILMEVIQKPRPTQFVSPSLAPPAPLPVTPVIPTRSGKDRAYDDISDKLVIDSLPLHQRLDVALMNSTFGYVGLKHVIYTLLVLSLVGLIWFLFFL
ncbi:MAG: hypothetical protein KF752_08825 [Pirellulaceae bacterium]|nr:hypothetical protein [Pirellulaceae bacterium]